MVLISKIVILLILLTPSLIFSQEGNGSMNAISVNITDIPSRKLSPIESIFKTFKNNISFLDRRVLEVEQLRAQIDILYSKNPITESNNNKIQENHKQLYNSFQNFTDFNTKKLDQILVRLIKKQPLKGSEISYLNKSFYTYKKYVEFNTMILKNSEKNLLNNPNKIAINLLHTQLNQLSFFYKNYFKSIANKQIRRVLNADDLAYKIKKNDLKRLILKQLRRKNYKSIQKRINDISFYPKNDVLIDTLLYKTIKSTVYNKSAIKKDKRKVRRLFNNDKAHNTGRTITHHLSGFVGNFTGLFRFRKGYLYKNDSIFNEIRNHLKPMDIIAEKTSFSLTDKLIPGHFGHIAIWLGTPKQLQKAQLWNHPSITPFHTQLKEGYCIIETDRKGTHLKTLRNFLNVDEFAIIRITNFENLPIDYKTVIYENSLAQLGKKYDFNFDLKTTNKLICTELLYYVFGSIHWPNEYYFNRSSISPDNALSLTLYKNSPTSLVYYVSAKNRKTIYQKSLLDLAKNLGYQKKDNAFMLVNKKCEKERNRTKKKCTSANRLLEYQYLN